MNRYLVFVGDLREKYTRGWECFVGDFNNLDKAKAFAYRKVFPFIDDIPETDEELLQSKLDKREPTWAQIVDSETYEIIQEYI